MKKIKKAAILCLCAGCFLLALGLTAAFTIGTLLVPIAISSSILLNSAGVVLFLYNKGGDDPE